MANKNIDDLYDKLDSIDRKLQKQIEIEEHRDFSKKESDSYNDSLIKLVIIVYIPFAIAIVYAFINHKNFNDLINASAFIALTISFMSLLKD